MMEEKQGERQDNPLSEVASAEQAFPSKPGFLDLVYGVFFDPRRTFASVAACPPLGRAVLLFSLVSLAGAVMSTLVSTHMFRYHPIGIHWLLPAAPFMSAASLIFQYLKWLVSSALIHLAASLLDGQGRATGILCVTALAALPTLLMVPVDFLLLLVGARGLVFMVVTALLGLAVFIWGVGLVVLGTSCVYGFTFSRALAAVILPPLVLVAGGAVVLILFLLSYLSI